MPSSVSSHASSAQGSGRMGHRLSIDRHESIQADLQVLEDQVRAWLQRILQQDFTAFWDDLRTGVPLCEVLTTLGHEVKYIGNAQAHTFKAADNIAQFLIVCQRHSLVPSYALFDTEDLIDHKNPRQVLLCLLRLAKIAIAQGVAPPKILKEELGIQELQSQSSLTEADIQKFIEDEDKARKELASSLFTATIVARDRPVDDTASVEGAAPSTIAARSASSEESCSDSQSIGPFSDSNHSPPRARRTPPLQTTISNNSQSSDSFEIRSHTSAQTRVQTTATANEATTEGRMTVQLDLDYTLVLQAVQAKHQRHMSQLMEEHAQQVAELEALHRRGMVALGNELGQQHDAKVQQLETNLEEQLAKLRSEHEAQLNATQDAHEQHLAETSRRMAEQHTAMLSERAAEHQAQVEALCRTHSEDRGTMRQQHQEALDALKQELGAEHGNRVRALQSRQEHELAAAARQHAEALEAMIAQFQEEKQRDAQEHEAKLEAELAQRAATHERMVAELEDQKEQQLRLQAEESTRALASAQEAHLGALREAHDAHQREKEELAQQHEAARLQHDEQRQQELQQQQQQMEEKHVSAIRELSTKHDEEVRAMMERVEAEKKSCNDAWEQKLQSLQQEADKDKAEHIEAIKKQAEQMAATVKDVAERHRVEQEITTIRHQQELREIEMNAKKETDAKLQQKDDELAALIAAMKRQHAEELEKQCMHHRRTLESVLHDGAVEKDFLLQQRNKEFFVRMQAFQQEATLRQSTQSARHAEELLAVQQQLARQNTSESGADRLLEVSEKKAVTSTTTTVFRHMDGQSSVVTYVSDSNDDVGKLIARKLSAPVYTGIRLYNHKKRGNYLMKKGAKCTPEFWVRPFGDTLMAFSTEWVDLDAFIRAQFDLPPVVVEPAPTQAVAVRNLSSLGSASFALQSVSSALPKTESYTVNVGGSMSTLSVVDLDSFYADL
eukprot:CAMPEP_0174280128 /NCGR_PEP_ID=MMETSP0809-20121228/400_1 /TAXON_ID=73025 ORGANISM="Eutreptiella gymnastica-like, Strain CCMP1594" /NCGR_SAMPLE_ID=MMETSP0809 /ASSEMBLY_ACC=CAM_ASM_000658 /LENGTH=955 /DNA_ID=CAMNT_0015372835 /DNA_START=29 /DNA_END=2896 /DNA_ORIENTATION=-